jgi:hypothetical protein
MHSHQMIQMTEVRHFQKHLKERAESEYTSSISLLSSVSVGTEATATLDSIELDAIISSVTASVGVQALSNNILLIAHNNFLPFIMRFTPF